MEKAVVNFRMDKTTKKEMEEICEDIGISKNSLTFIKGNSYELTGGILNTNHLEFDVKILQKSVCIFYQKK